MWVRTSTVESVMSLVRNSPKLKTSDLYAVRFVDETNAYVVQQEFDCNFSAVGSFCLLSF